MLVLIRVAFETGNISGCTCVLHTRGFLTIEKPCDLRHRYTSYIALQHKVLPFTHSASFQDTGKAWSNLFNFRPFKTTMKIVSLAQTDKIIFTTSWRFLGTLRWHGWANRLNPCQPAKNKNPSIAVNHKKKKKKDIQHIHRVLSARNMKNNSLHVFSPRTSPVSRLAVKQGELRMLLTDVSWDRKWEYLGYANLNSGTVNRETLHKHDHSSGGKPKTRWKY